MLLGLFRGNSVLVNHCDVLRRMLDVWLMLSRSFLSLHSSLESERYRKTLSQWASFCYHLPRDRSHTPPFGPYPTLYTISRNGLCLILTNSHGGIPLWLTDSCLWSFPGDYSEPWHPSFTGATLYNLGFEEITFQDFLGSYSVVGTGIMYKHIENFLFVVRWL